MNASRPLRFLSAAVLAALVAACTVGPNYKVPETPVDPSYGAAEAGAKAADWWTAFRDPALESLLRAAAENSLDLKFAAARLHQSRAELHVANSSLFPQADVNAGFQHDRFSQNAAPFNAFNIPNFPWEYNNYQPGFDASWEIDLFGGTRRSIEAGNAAVESAEYDRRAVLVTLLGEVARNYTLLRGYQDRRAIAEKNLQVQNESLDLTRDRMKNGVGSELDVSRALAGAQETAALLPLYDRGEWQALYRLALLTDQPLEKLTPLLAPAPLPQPPADNVFVGVPADLLRRRPDIARAERALAAATARVGMAEADLYPRLSLTGFFNLQSASVEDLFDWKSRAFSIGPTITWPIFQGGRLRALVDVRNAQEEESLAQYEQSVQNAIAEVRDQLTILSTARKRADSLAKAIAAEQESLDLARELYSRGMTDFLTVLDAQRRLYETQDNLSQVKTEEIASLIALYKALGGDWQMPEISATSQPAPPATPPTAPPVAAPATSSSNPKESKP